MGPGDREFLIHPSFGAAVKTALQPSVVSETTSRAFTKKPFDWLLDEQFTNLQVGPLFCCFFFSKVNFTHATATGCIVRFLSPLCEDRGCGSGISLALIMMS